MGTEGWRERSASYHGGFVLRHNQGQITCTSRGNRPTKHPAANKQRTPTRLLKPKDNNANSQCRYETQWPHLTTPVFRVPNECTGPWLGPSPLGDHSTPPPPLPPAPFFLLAPTTANAPPRPPSPPPAAAAAAAAAFI